MADTLCVRMGCNSAESFRNNRAVPVCCSLRDQLQPESLAFQKSVSIRLPLRSLQVSCCPRRVSVQVNAVVGYPASMTWWKKGNQPNMREINSAQEFVEAIAKAGDKLVLVDFYSVSCRSCKALHPKICQIAADNPDIEVLKVNFYDNNALCRSLKINKLRVAVAKHKSGHLALPAPGPVVPVANRKDILGLPTPALATAGSVA